MDNTDQYRGFVDQSFDEHFQQLQGLTWLPWVGSAYRTTSQKTIILGESVYVWESAAGHEATKAKIEHPENLRKLHMSKGMADSYPKGKRKRAYLSSIERAALLKRHPSAEQRQKLWTEVMYFNLVQRPMLSLKHRPEHKDYVKGWDCFFEIAHLLQADRCVVYGTDKDKITTLKESAGVTIVQEKCFALVGQFTPRYLKIAHNGREVEFLFVRHPSAFFAWKEWGAVMRQCGFCLDSSLQEGQPTTA